MAETEGEGLYVVQAWHYAQYEVTSDPDADEVEVEILDEDDCSCVLVAVRATLEEAERAAEEWDGLCRTVEDAEDVTGQPIAAINVFKVPSKGPVKAAGEWLRSTVDNTVGG